MGIFPNNMKIAKIWADLPMFYQSCVYTHTFTVNEAQKKHSGHWILCAFVHFPSDENKELRKMQCGALWN